MSARKLNLEDEWYCRLFLTCCRGDASGLDNAGKTTIVKKLMDEDVHTVSPTLGFIIRTVDYGG